MSGPFKIDGPLYRFLDIVYCLVLTNALWIIFSIPLVTIGASTTSLFYVTGRVVRGEDIKVVKDFWKSFRMNFFQATGIWLILFVLYFLVYNSMLRVGTLGDISDYVFAVQLFVLIEIVIVTVYIFPLLSRYDIKFFRYFKLSFVLGNKHMLTTILCLGSLGVIVLSLYQFISLFSLVFVSLYALVSYYFINRIFKRYTPEDRKGDEE